MKNTLIGITVLAIILVAYTQMPWQWRRHKDIEHGNTIIQNIEQYRQQHHRLPDVRDHATLQQLGFHQNKQGWQPNYERINDTHYAITYRDGFTPPYLRYSSADSAAQWQLVTPTQPAQR